MKKAHFFVSGGVQGVCYRHYCANKARELGIKGFVRNAPNGKVEVVIEGEDNKLDEFMDYCKNNPGYSSVEKIEIREKEKIKSSGFSDFEIRY